MTDLRTATPEQSFADRAFAVAADAYAQEPGGWESAIQAAISQLFDFLADHPDQTRACVLARGAGDDELARLQDVTVGRFGELLRPGFTDPQMPSVVAEGIAGGIFELVRRYAVDRRLRDLPKVVPDATYLALAPFVGPDDAAALANAPAS